MVKVTSILGAFVMVFFAAAFLALLIGFPVMWMMNYVLSPGAIMAVFGVTQLTFWKAFWLSFLTATLFKSSVTTK